MNALNWLRRACVALCLGVGLATVAMATSSAAVTPVALDEAGQRDLARIEAYLNDLTTLDSRFVQLSQDGFVEGRLRLSRPGDMRIDYAEPVPVEIVASGVMVMYHDRELGQTTFLPVSETPAYFLLRDRIDLSDGLTVTAYEREASAIRMTVVESGNPDAGQITIVFEDKPLRLVKWRVVDAAGNVIDVALVDPRFGVTFDNARELFSTVDPQFGNPNE